MKRNLYNLKIRKGGVGIGIGGIGIGIGGIGIGLGDELDTIIPEGYKFYNVQLDRVLYYLACSNGDTLGSVVDHNLTAYNVS